MQESLSLLSLLDELMPKDCIFNAKGNIRTTLHIRQTTTGFFGQPEKFLSGQKRYWLPLCKWFDAPQPFLHLYAESTCFIIIDLVCKNAPR